MSVLLHYVFQSEHDGSGYEADDDASVGFDGSEVYGQSDGEGGAVDQIILVFQTVEVNLFRAVG